MICNQGVSPSATNFQLCGEVASCGTLISTSNGSTIDQCVLNCNQIRASCEVATFDNVTGVCSLYDGVTQAFRTPGTITYKNTDHGIEIVLASSCSVPATAFPTVSPTPVPGRRLQSGLEFVGAEGFYTRDTSRHPYRWLQTTEGRHQYQGNCTPGVNVTVVTLTYETPDGSSTIGVVGAVNELLTGAVTLNVTVNVTLCQANTDVVLTSTDAPTPQPTLLPTAPTRRPSKIPTERPTKFGDTKRPSRSPTPEGATPAPTEGGCCKIKFKKLLLHKFTSPGRIIKLSYKMHNDLKEDIKYGMFELDLPPGVALYKSYAFPALKGHKNAEVIDDSTVIWRYAGLPKKKGRTFTFGLKVTSCPPDSILDFRATYWELAAAGDIDSRFCPQFAPDVEVSLFVMISLQ